MKILFFVIYVFFGPSLLGAAEVIDLDAHPRDILAELEEKKDSAWAIHSSHIDDFLAKYRMLQIHPFANEVQTAYLEEVWLRLCEKSDLRLVDAEKNALLFQYLESHHEYFEGKFAPGLARDLDAILRWQGKFGLDSDTVYEGAMLLLGLQDIADDPVMTRLLRVVVLELTSLDPEWVQLFTGLLRGSRLESHFAEALRHALYFPPLRKPMPLAVKDVIWSLLWSKMGLPGGKSLPVLFGEGAFEGWNVLQKREFTNAWIREYADSEDWLLRDIRMMAAFKVLNLSYVSITDYLSRLNQSGMNHYKLGWHYALLFNLGLRFDFSSGSVKEPVSKRAIWETLLFVPDAMEGLLDHLRKDHALDAHEKRFLQDTIREHVHLWPESSVFCAYWPKLHKFLRAQGIQVNSRIPGKVRDAVWAREKNFGDLSNAESRQLVKSASPDDLEYLFAGFPVDNRLDLFALLVCRTTPGHENHIPPREIFSKAGTMPCLATVMPRPQRLLQVQKGEGSAFQNEYELPMLEGKGIVEVALNGGQAVNISVIRELVARGAPLPSRDFANARVQTLLNSYNYLDRFADGRRFAEFQARTLMRWGRFLLRHWFLEHGISPQKDIFGLIEVFLADKYFEEWLHTKFLPSAQSPAHAFWVAKAHGREEIAEVIRRLGQRVATNAGDSHDLAI